MLLAGSTPLTETPEFAIFTLILGAAVGFGFNYLQESLKARREPKRRLSWDMSFEPGLGEILPELRKDISISYLGTLVDSVSIVRVRVANTGNQVVKKQQVRLTFGANSSVLRAQADPPPLREIGYRRKTDRETGPFDFCFELDHLERSQEVAVVAVVGGEIQEPEVVGFNDQGGVEFIPRELASAKEARPYLRTFTVLLFLFATLPQVLQIAGDEFGLFSSLFTDLIRAILFAFLVRYVGPVARTIQELVNRYLADRQPDTKVEVFGGVRNLAVGTGKTFVIKDKAGDDDSSDGDPQEATSRNRNGGPAPR